MPANSKGDLTDEIALGITKMSLQRLDVLSLPALRALGYVELHGLALLQALKAACLDR